MSLLLVYGQLVATAVLVKAIGIDGDSMATHYENRRQSDLGRQFLLGDSRTLEAPRICRWKTTATSSGATREAPPSPLCNPDRLDVALHVANPDSFETHDYEKLFNGLVERIHLCTSCTPDAIITIEPSGAIRSDAFSTQGLILLRLSRNNDEVQKQFVTARRELDRLRTLTGATHLHSAGLRQPVSIDALQGSLAVIFNIAALIMISLWLALKAHRKVLDYFARNGALLPMVAATGKSTFYGALWILTLARVGAFLCAAIPMTYFGFEAFAVEDNYSDLFLSNYVELGLWICALGASLGLATLIASISDLQQRHHFLSVLYKYLPLVLCIGGTIIWTATFLADSPFFGILRSVITALPVVGMGPILIAPTMKPDFLVLGIHAVLTSILFSVALKKNARWFAAHLEEL
jgi:hypothetical protein